MTNFEDTRMTMALSLARRMAEKKIRIPSPHVYRSICNITQDQALMRLDFHHV